MKCLKNTNFLVLLLSLFLFVDAAPVIQILSFSELKPVYIVNAKTHTQNDNIYLVAQVEKIGVSVNRPDNNYFSSNGKFIVISRYDENVVSYHMYSEGDVNLSGVSVSDDGSLYLCGNSSEPVIPFEQDKVNENNIVFYVQPIIDKGLTSNDFKRVEGEQCMGIVSNSETVYVIVLKKEFLKLYISDKDPIPLLKIIDTTINVISVKVEKDTLEMIFSKATKGGQIFNPEIDGKSLNISDNLVYNFTMSLKLRGLPNVDPIGDIHDIALPLTAKTDKHLYFITNYIITQFDFKLHLLSLDYLLIDQLHLTPTLPTPTEPTEPEPSPTEPTKPEPSPTKPTNPEPSPTEPTPTQPEPSPTKPTEPEPTPTKPKPTPTEPEPTLTEPTSTTPTNKSIPTTIKSSPPNTPSGTSDFMFNEWAIFGLVFLILLAFSFLLYRYYQQNGFGVLGTLCNGLKNSVSKKVSKEPRQNKEDFRNAREFYL